MRTDEAFMRRALALAARGGFRVSPNPRVGCVLVKAGRVVGEGWHRRAGGPHAEAQALARAGARARGATAYVSLEPCAGYPGKRTPACAEALRAAGVRRVVAAVRDPHPGVSGRGLALLRRAGVAVSTGLLAAEARALNRPFELYVREGRPWVTLKAAATLDGRIEDASGRSRWLTSPAARALARRLRGEHDAVLVGSGTVLADDPRLSAPGCPLKVVLDARARVSARARLFRTPGRALVVSASRRRLPAGADLLRLPAGRDGVAPRAVLRELARRGVGRLFVEGGSAVHTSFLDAGLVDEVRLFVAPRLVGGTRARSYYEGRGRPLGRALALDGLQVRRVGPDILVSGLVRR